MTSKRGAATPGWVGFPDASSKRYFLMGGRGRAVPVAG